MNNQNIKKRFEKSYDKWSEKIFSFVLYKISDKEKALDITQETFIKTWDYLREGKKIRNMKPFLYKTANNLVIDEYRKRDRRKTGSLDNLLEEGIQFETEDGNPTRNKSEFKLVLEHIDELPEMYRDAVTFRLVEEMSVKEIAEILDENPGTISVRVYRGVKMLKESFNE